MKKLITLVLTLALFFGINAFLVVNADSVNVQFNKTGLGYTLNAVKSAYIDVSEIRTGSPIFNEEWLENIIVLRYGASGKNDDDWKNKDVYVQITYSK